ncbi:hypothetical protein M427DRAFT_53575 [Gonapodya prolifera JEL478]|uniref:Uncharacterized protein n=1 Tax=Gonapodya prolifera (strain JEL478) TaxID=1344416 RepID=A0A139APP7_GONPJ|nr:hypothetical protein M427DRAFT_53575 [Gonapodya prolifera JEL478]|eukprot:KXS18624.1 hypothetical protein M427DRAFT_53575 [Gonapodya prolifera JEL478]
MYTSQHLLPLSLSQHVSTQPPTTSSPPSALMPRPAPRTLASAATPATLPRRRRRFTRPTAASFFRTRRGL